ncbi:MAG: caspase family protein [Bacteroidota bacterium]|jgi:hypothetical protein|nr:MAG: peptidase C14 [Bacteroidota bacterium]
MPKGYSLHIGLNTVNPDHYDGWDGRLVACESDAIQMSEIAKKMNFASIDVKLTKEATRDQFKDIVRSYSKKLQPGDLFLLTYSGHGGQLPDLNNDEADAIDETWCMYDGQIADDEIYELWSGFKEGVRVLVFSDSCHSGTVVRDMLAGITSNIVGENGTEIRYRFMPWNVANKTYMKNRSFYDEILYNPKTKEDAKNIKCTVRLISGCQDNQYSLDGPFNGLFTGTLLRIWNNGRFKGNYDKFHKAILNVMPRSQSPNHFVIGKHDPVFADQSPFQI